MKKILSILMSSALLLGLVGCNSANNNQQAVTNSTQGTEVTVTNTTVPEYQVYSLEGMSSEDIFNLLISFSKDINTGDTMENYVNRFSVEPCSNNGNSYMFWHPENTSNCISNIICDAQIEMNNTITVKYDSKITISILINDYSIVSDLYDRLYQYLCQNTPNQDNANFDNREGTSWYSQVHCAVWTEREDGSRLGSNYSYEVRLEQSWMDNNNYELRVDLPIIQ